MEKTSMISGVSYEKITNTGFVYKKDNTEHYLDIASELFGAY